jgi:hypothetical protein
MLMLPAELRPFRETTSSTQSVTLIEAGFRAAQIELRVSPDATV